MASQKQPTQSQLSNKADLYQRSTFSEKPKFSFMRLEVAGAHALLHWRYEPPYDVYNFPSEPTEEVLASLLDPAHAYHAIFDESGEFVAYCCFGADAQVPGGDYQPKALDIGLGVRPDWMGQGLGHRFVKAVFSFARRTFLPDLYRVTIASFNKRALHVWQKEGFEPTQTFRDPAGQEFIILCRPADD